MRKPGGNNNPHGRGGKPNGINVDNIHIDSERPSGTSESAGLRRLRKDRPELFSSVRTRVRELLASEIPAANANGGDRKSQSRDTGLTQKSDTADAITARLKRDDPALANAVGRPGGDKERATCITHNDSSDGITARLKRDDPALASEIPAANAHGRPDKDGGTVLSNYDQRGTADAITARLKRDDPALAEKVGDPSGQCERWRS